MSDVTISTTPDGSFVKRRSGASCRSPRTSTHPKYFSPANGVPRSTLLRKAHLAHRPRSCRQICNVASAFGTFSARMESRHVSRKSGEIRMREFCAGRQSLRASSHRPFRFLSAIFKLSLFSGVNQPLRNQQAAYLPWYV